MTEKRSTGFSLPGEYRYNGIPMSGACPESALKKCEQFQYRDDDVVVAAYPKCGTTWTQEITWIVQNNGDIETAKAASIDDRVPFMEFIWPGTVDSPEIVDIDRLADMTPPRVMRTHLWVRFFEHALENTAAKFIVVMRNPKDVFISYYHLYTSTGTLGNYKGTWNDFFEDLVKDDHLAWGSWFDYQLGWWRIKDSPNILILKYEDMSKDLGKAVRSIASFLGKQLPNDVIEKIVHHTSFDQMKDNPKVNRSEYSFIKSSISPFMRKGKVGDWKNYYTKEESDFIDRKMEEKLAGTGLTFEFE